MGEGMIVRQYTFLLWYYCLQQNLGELIPEHYITATDTAATLDCLLTLINSIHKHRQKTIIKLLAIIYPTRAIVIVIAEHYCHEGLKVVTLLIM